VPARDGCFILARHGILGYSGEMENEEAYIKRLAEDPGDDCFVDYAEYLRTRGRLLEGLSVSLAGLTANPAALRGRLILARILFNSGYIPFAIREIEELNRAVPGNAAIARLKEVILQDKAAEDMPAGQVEEEIVAEAFLDVEDLE